MFRPVLLFSLLAVPLMALDPALMPLPVKVQSGSGKLAIDNSFTAASSGYSDARLKGAIQRFTQRLARQTGLLLDPAPTADASHATLRVECAAAGPAYPTLGEDESYTLDVSANGAVVKAATVDGAMHGLETLLQWISPGADGFQAAAVHIEDKPRFPWRGLMIDSSRHFMPVPVIERNLDAMAAVKLNVFHWHLSDDQGFRVESKKFPNLQELGSDGHYYTQSEIRHIVEYARDRGIRVIPEFDIPGHTQSWFPGYPELASAPGPYTIGRTWGIYDPVMDPSKPETYEFLDAFIGEMTQLFPDPYFHIGGDEVNGRQWKASEKMQEFAKQHHLEGAHDLQLYFNRQVSKTVQKYGKIMIGWDEVLHPDLPQTTVIQSWRGNAALAEAASKGHPAILSWGYYLDHLRPASYHYGIDPLGGDAAKLPPDAASHILGGEACMWAEYVNAETVDSRIWPRAAAIAERYWSPKETTDVPSMYARMEAISRRLDWTGVQHRTGYQPMLDRLTGGVPAEPVRILADACEAQGLGGRARARKYTSLIPLNRFVDAVRPENESLRAVEQAAAKVVLSPSANGADAALLRERFTQWSTNDTRFQPLAEGDVMLAELKSLSADLSVLGEMGLQALDALTGKTAVTPGWLQQQKAEIARMQRPNAEVVLAGTRPVKLLLDSIK